ncbi:MAG: MBL fold metallo-hydrolase [Desulfobacter sp.]|nr:MAG: MBL fold metallo-hydrolase [Desulfobacter sp.]
MRIKDKTMISRALPMPHQKNNKFYTDVSPMIMNWHQTLSAAIDFLFENNNRVPQETLPVIQTDLSRFASGEKQGFNTTWLGHSSLMINMDGFKILLDPVFEPKLSMVGPKRFNGPLPLVIEALPPIDLVIISHDHYDHLNKFSIQAIQEKTGLFMVPLGVEKHLSAWGMPPPKDRLPQLVGVP